MKLSKYKILFISPFSDKSWQIEFNRLTFISSIVVLSIMVLGSIALLYFSSPIIKEYLRVSTINKEIKQQITNLKIGDIINVTFPELSGGRSKKIDQSMSGNYLIARLNHHMQPNASFSSLNLIRDSYGYSEAYPVDTLNSGDIVEEVSETEEQVQADNEQYGNTFPSGSF